ncbi:MAG: hypothetical protein HY907_13800 [Deltaproteobacteria bacterium]|nr:hypothetical protein [Deltaproteobacteria bacterium]
MLAACGLATAAALGCSGTILAGDGDDDADAAGEDGGADATGESDGVPPDGDDPGAGGDAPDGGDDAAGDAWTTRVVTMATIQVATDYAPGGAFAWMCRCEGPRPPPPEVWAEAGGCRLQHDPYGEPLDPTMCVPLDVGEIELTIDGTTYPLDWPGTVHPCYWTFGPDLPELAEGMTVRMTGTGGADLPAFAATFTVPPHVTMTVPPLAAEWTVGERWEVRWEPPVEVDARFSLPSRGHLNLLCEAANIAPPLVAPASVTALWDELGDGASLNFVASHTVVVDGEVPLTIEVGWGDVAAISFLPPP